MIHKSYPKFTVVAIRDEKSDAAWSSHLDIIIGALTFGEVMLYGGRDSFIPKYCGMYKNNCVITPIIGHSGTEQRRAISKMDAETTDFRSGIIYAVTNQRPRVMMTVDVAIIQHNPQAEGGYKVLLGKKANEQNYRFIGGFVEPGESLEAAARREVYEETNVALEEIMYVQSFPINDWRYAQDSDAKITTAFFLGWATSLSKKAGDDIETCTWFDINNIPQLEPEHILLHDALNVCIEEIL
jgi:ADP-ribose pyrophosphatase YjhB (NUDIX family)